MVSEKSPSNAMATMEDPHVFTGYSSLLFRKSTPSSIYQSTILKRRVRGHDEGGRTDVPTLRRRVTTNLRPACKAFSSSPPTIGTLPVSLHTQSTHSTCSRSHEIMPPQQKVTYDKEDKAVKNTGVGPDGSRGNVSIEEAMDLPFSIKTLREAIPKECFHKSLFWSMFFCLRDWAIVAALYHFRTTFFDQGILGKLVWWNLVGFWGWCLFVIGHDCGHGSFSNYGLFNQFIGHICHMVLCVPFNGWRISHREHHQYHNHIHKDHSWRPFTKTEYMESTMLPTGLARFTPLVLWLYPIYLTMESQECGFSGNHFNPFSPLFAKEERLGGAISSLSVIGWVSFLFYNFDVSTLVQNYWIPYLIFVAWLDLVTYMQHTDEKALYYRGSSWNYLRGALSTFDRTYRHLIDPFNLGYGRIIDAVDSHTAGVFFRLSWMAALIAALFVAIKALL